MASTDQDTDIAGRLEALERRIAKALDRLDRERTRTSDRFGRDIAELGAMQQAVAAQRRRYADGTVAESKDWRTVGDEIRALEDQFRHWTGRLDRKFGF